MTPGIIDKVFELLCHMSCTCTYDTRKNISVWMLVHLLSCCCQLSAVRNAILWFFLNLISECKHSVFN